MQKDNEIVLTIPSDLKFIDITVSIAEKLMINNEYNEKEIREVRLAIHEILINAVKHGNKANPDTKVITKFILTDKCFYISIEDEGEGFDINSIPDPTLPENILKPSGRGLFL